MKQKDLEGRGHGLIEVLSQHFPQWTEENHKKTQSRQLVKAKTGTKHLENTKQWC